MKTILKYRIFIFSCVIVLVAGSCKKDFLDRPPLSQITTDNFYKTTADLRLATAAVYAQPWFDWNYFPLLGMGDIMSGNMLQPYNGGLVQLTSFSITSGNEYVANSWRCFYKIVAHCNTNIKAINTQAPDSISAANKHAAIGELKFLRATAYFYLAQLWGSVPIIEDNDILITHPLLPRHKVEDVYKFIVSDLSYAAQYLPRADAPGRVTTWSAQGLLSKVYLTRAGLGQNGTRLQKDLDSAKYYAGNVCNSSGLSLLPSYYNLFRTQFNDNPESLFAFQWAPGVGYGNGNAIQAQFAPSGDLVTSGGGWGGAIGPTIDLYNLYDVKDSIRRKATFMLKGDYYPELNAAGGGFRQTGDANVKKHVVGTAKDNNSATMDLWSSIEHNAVLRLADVYLVYVEAIMGNSASTSDAEALKYFNKVRNRAGLDLTSPMTTVSADTLFKERRIELAFEGQYWYDLVRLSYYNPAKAINSINNQTRRQFTYNNGIATPTANGIVITPATIATFTLPLPATEITADPKLLDPPVAYY
ncbi:MAG: RagB/SusD family nutrient uptake outer membrane protein [Ferruginibacter sp.]|nr:RagB/SusD family nutrient uptake outer membrane protein [Ferruginibacter sp.]